jgi:hypothetical protein
MLQKKNRPGGGAGSVFLRRKERRDKSIILIACTVPCGTAKINLCGFGMLPDKYQITVPEGTKKHPNFCTNPGL